MASERTGALTAIAIIAIVLGLLGACGGVLGIGSLLVQGPLAETQRRMFEQSGAPPEQIEAQLAMQDQANEVQRKWLPFTGTHQALNLIASSLLLAAGILLLRTSRTGPTLFVAAVAANAFVDIGGTVIGVLVQMDMQEVMRGMFDTASMGDPQMDRFLDGIMKASSWTGLCFTAVWVGLKLGYYLWGVLYLRKPAVRALFATR